ncbi:MAG: transposase [Nannocystis sp.]|nr:transposase [Nannocystis sp.]
MLEEPITSSGERHGAAEIELRNRGLSAVGDLGRARFALQRSPWKLDAVARQKLTDLEKENQPHYRAYLMKEALAATFDTSSPESIHDDLTGWLRWVEAEGLPPLVKAAGTSAAHFDGILGEGTCMLGQRLARRSFLIPPSDEDLTATPRIGVGCRRTAVDV